ncbi:Sec23/Sec24 family protein [Histoplasma capsulatum G186AR]|uniref:Sec23/Sec24 family protein n=1 Tax=Ajellomyces capsulatus TaxID=5037 RepID=A0A8H8D6H2_AJECA|nr:Sec23/Sec24 family protein [Histoplasma capsulatum]QSS69306.1 Sec23/Sec24 family protein [Histoplasma capsulatum G186AR]
MADFSTYHSLGQGEEDMRTAGAPPQFNPPIAQGHPSYQHNKSPHGDNPSPMGPMDSAGYSSGLPGETQGGDTMGGLSSQMGGLGISGAMGGSIRTHKKKDRHAYHDIGVPSPTSQTFNGMAQSGIQLQSGMNQQLPPSSPYSHSASPGSQQPLQSGQPFGGSAKFSSAGDGSVSTQGKVDPEQVPGVPIARDVAAQYYLNHVYATMERHIPPPATVPFVAHDQGNSSPKFARLTLNNIPSTLEFLSSTALPLGMVLQPLAPIDSGEQPIPVLDFGDAGPPRCRRCRAYINPFMMFRSGGNKFVCNMCTFPNEVPPEYFSPLEPSGVRVDRMQRPELMLGTVEYMVPKEYWGNVPVGLRWLFLIDVSQESVTRGFLEASCEGIIGALYGGSSDDQETQDQNTRPGKLPAGSKVGIITFDKEVHFYNLCSRLEQAQMIVMTDLNDPFLPLSEGLFVDPYESKHVISSLLTQIPTLFSHIKNPEPALLPAINAALSALEQTGGKMICTLASLPTWGPGRLFMRDDGKGSGTDAEKKLLTTDHPGWKRTANKLSESGVGIDFFLASCGGAYMDVATIGHVAAVSGGETFLYPNFHSPRDVLKLSNELSHAVNRETGYQALLKVRCSNGLQVSSYHGNYVQHTFGSDLQLGSIDADKAFGVVFTYDGKLDTKLDAHFQAALLYTTASGQRRVRCINIVAGVNEGGMETMKAIDQDAVVNIMAKEAASKVPDKSHKDIRAGLTERTIDILAGYRKNFSLSHPPGQLVLPENMKEFAMYILSLIKCRAFKAGHETSDRRVHDTRMLRSFGCNELALYLYPHIIPIHNLRPEDGFANEQDQLQVPPALRASFSRIEEGGAYLVDNGQICLLWLHAQVSPNLLEDLFGPGKTTLQSLDPNISSLPLLETHLNAQVRNIIQYLSTIRGSKSVTIQLARQGIDGSEYEFARLLLEDRNNDAQSYVDWLVHIHRQIQLELGGQRKKEEGSAVASGVENSLSGLSGLRPPYW